MTLRTLLIGTSLALIGCAPLGPQREPVPQATEDAILRAVSEYVMTKIASKTAHVDREVDVVLDRAILPRGDADRGATWPAAVLQDIAGRAGARVSTLNDLDYTCPRDAPPGYCYLEGADIVVTVGRPILDGECGTIQVREVARATGDIDAPRAYRSSAGLKIERVGGTWQVVGADFISVSD